MVSPSHIASMPLCESLAIQVLSDHAVAFKVGAY